MSGKTLVEETAAGPAGEDENRSISGPQGDTASKYRDGPPCPECDSITRVHPRLGSYCPTCRDAKEDAPERPVLVRLSDVDAEQVEWLASPYIPIGKLTLLMGDPGLGKTWIALWMAARISRGEEALPGSSAAAPGTVLYMSAEDGLADTIRPRLDAAGADPSKVVALTGKRSASDEEVAISLSDLASIEAAVIQERPRLIVVDPIQAFLGSGVDMHRANEVRPLLAGLARLAEEYGCAVLPVCHMRKSSADRAVYRGLGSIDFAAAARSILLVAEDRDDEDRRVLGHVKSNLAHQGESLGFKIGGDQARVEWLGPVDVDVEELLKPRKPKPQKTLAAEVFLTNALADGSRPAAWLIKHAPCSERTLKSAKKALGIETSREGFGGDGAWYWSLPATKGVKGGSLPSLCNQDDDQPGDSARLSKGVKGVTGPKSATTRSEDEVIFGAWGSA